MTEPIKSFEEVLDDALKAGARLSDLTLIIGGEGTSLVIGGLGGLSVQYSKYISVGTAFLRNDRFLGILPFNPFKLSDDQKAVLENQNRRLSDAE